MDKQIRITHIIGSVAKGGIESVVFNYYRFINRDKVQFDFIIDEDSPCEIPDDILNMGCRVFKIPPYTKFFAYIKALKRIFRENNCKIVHSHMNTLSVFALYAAKKAGVPVRISHNHSTAGKGRGEFKRNVIKYALRRFSRLYPTHLAACSEYAGKWLYGDKADFKVFNNAIDPARFTYNTQTRLRVRENLGAGNKFIIGHVGRFMHQKNHDFLIDIFNEIYKLNQDSLLLLIGDGELKKPTEEKVKALNLQNNVIFTGNRSDVNELYQAMDVLVLPSLYEGLTVVGVEAQTAGLPLVLSACISKETAFTDAVEFISLKESAKHWAEKVLSKQNFERVDISGLPNAQKFIISNEAGKLEKFYEEVSKD